MANLALVERRSALRQAPGMDSLPLPLLVRQDDERDPSRVVGTPWLHLALRVQRELLPQEQILGGELGMRPHCLRDKPHDVPDETQDRPNGSARSGQAHGRRILCESRKPRMRQM
jgi:hypothetical protein